MALPPLASLEAFTERLGANLGEPASQDGVRAVAALEDASALIRSEAGTDWVDDHDDLLLDIPDVIETICLAVAYRAFRNPDGTTQTSVGDVSVSFSREGVAGAVFLTKAEQRAVRKAAGRSSVGSVLMDAGIIGGGGYDYTRLRYAPTQGDPIPLGPWPWEA